MSWNFGGICCHDASIHGCSFSELFPWKAGVCRTTWHPFPEENCCHSHQSENLKDTPPPLPQSCLYAYPYVSLHYTLLFFFLWRCGPTLAMTSSFLRFLDHTQRHVTVGRNPPGEWSVRRTDLYLRTHNTHNRQTSMPPVGFEPTISAGERPKTYALDRAATETVTVVLVFTRGRKKLLPL